MQNIPPAGSWRVLPPYTNGTSFLIGCDRKDGATDILAEVNSCGGTPDQCPAYARLMAAAPDLLAALKDLLYNRDAAEAFIRDLEGKPVFDYQGNATPCTSPEATRARDLIFQLTA